MINHHFARWEHIENGNSWSCGNLEMQYVKVNRFSKRLYLSSGIIDTSDIIDRHFVHHRHHKHHGQVSVYDVTGVDDAR